MAIGDLLIRRNDLDGTTTITTANTDLLWDTEVEVTGTGITYSSGEFNLVAAGWYLVIWNEEFYTSNTTNNTRFGVQGEVLIDGSPIMEARCSMYIRKSSGQQQAILKGIGLIKTASANAKLKTRVYRDDSSTTGTCVRQTDHGGVQIIRLDESDAYAIYASTSDQTLVADTAVDTILASNVQQDTGFTRTGNSVDLSSAGRYLVTMAMDLVSTSANQRTEIQMWLEKNGTPVPGSYHQCYIRGTQSLFDGAMSHAVLIDAAAGDDIVWRVARREGVNVAVQSGARLTFWEIPSGNAVAIMEATTGDMNATGDFTWDTLPVIDTSNFTATAGNQNIDVDQVSDYLVLAGLGLDTLDAGADRATPYVTVEAEGTALTYGMDSSYHRGSGTAGFASHGPAAILKDFGSGTGEIKINIPERGSTVSSALNQDSGFFAVLDLGTVFGSLTHYTLTADGGTYTVAGSVADPEVGYAIDADSGSYSETGTDATLTHGTLTHYTITADGGSATHTGTAAALEYGRAIDAGVGAFDATGSASGLEVGYLVDAAAASYTHTGTDATLTYSSPTHYSLTMDAGAFTHTGTAATLKYGRRIDASSIGAGQYETGTASVVPTNWYGDTYGDNGIPGANIGDEHDCPWTGATLKRLTKAAGTTGDELWNIEYPSNQKVSADGDKFIVNNGVTNASKVIDSDGTLICNLPIGTSLTGFWWSNTDNDLIYFVDAPFQKKIKKIVPSTGTITTVLDLSSYTMTRGYSIDRVDVGECEISEDGRYISVGVNKNSAAANKGNLLIDLTAARVCGELYRIDVSADFFDASAYGDEGELYWKVAVIPGSGPTYWECWDANDTGSGDAGVATERWSGSGLTQTTGLGTGHNTLFTAPDGNHYFITVDNYNNHVWRFALADSGPTPTPVKLWSMGWFANAQTDRPNGIDEYFCGRSCAHDGWIYCCVWPGSWHGDPDLAWRKYMDEVFRFKWNGDETSIERILHHRCNSYNPNYNDKNYWAYPRIDVHRGGDVILVSTNFQRSKKVGIDRRNTDVYLHTVLTDTCLVNGTEAGLQRGLLIAAGIGAHSATGTAATLTAGRDLTASSGTYTFTGTAATLTKTGGYSVSADAGTVSVSGTAAAHRHAWRVGASGSSYSATGTPAGVAYGRAVDAATTSYSATGADATLTVAGDSEIVAESGSASISGTAAGLHATRTLDMAAGAISVSGQDATFTLPQLLAANPGSVTVAGSSAVLDALLIDTSKGRKKIVGYTGNRFGVVKRYHTKIYRYGRFR